MRKHVKIVVVMGVVALVALAASAAVLAQGPTVPGSSGWFGRRPDVGGIASYFEQVREAVASKLGVTTDELDQARTEARQEVIEQAVVDGEITQEQADRMLSDEHLGERGRGRFGPGMGAGFADEEAHYAALAKVLGMTVEELEAELADGKTLRNLAEEQGVDMDSIWDALKDAREAALEQAVEEGRLTQEQADRMLAQATRGFGRFGGGRKRGGHPDFQKP